MALRRVFADRVGDDLAEVGGDRAHHLARVARLRLGEAVEVSDGERAWPAEVVEISDKQVRFRLGRELPPPPPRPRVRLYPAVVKPARLEWAVEKATELGVEAITPLAAERSDPAFVKTAAKRLDRLQRIAEAAAQQARLLRAPAVSAPVSVAEALAEAADRRYWADFGGGALAAAQPGETVAVFVGPEGGWTESEREAAEASGAVRVSVGSTVLRAETAATAAAALLMIR